MAVGGNRHGGRRRSPVRGIRTSIIAILAIGLLAGSAVGVAAQEEATAVEFTGATSFGPCSLDYCDNPVVKPFTDPRLEGQFRVWGGANEVTYPSGPTIRMVGFSMHDDAGGWVQRPSIAVTHADGEDATKVIVMDGQGAYEGLTLVAEVSLSSEVWDWHGYILDGELPPAPTIELPE
jgi:hypothetical protein